MREQKAKNIRSVLLAERERLSRYIRARIQNTEDAQDLLQDVYLRAMSRLNAMDQVDNLLGWLYSVARNRIIDWYRGKKRTMLSLDAPETASADVLKQIIADVETESDAEMREFIYGLLYESISELPEKQRFVIEQQSLSGRTFQELALETGDSINTLIARKRYALLFLRKRLETIKSLLDQSVD